MIHHDNKFYASRKDKNVNVESGVQTFIHSFLFCVHNASCVVQYMHNGTRPHSLNDNRTDSAQQSEYVNISN